MQQKNNRPENDRSALAIGMCLGLCIGSAIGAATRNLGLWMSVGLSLGLCFGLIFGRKQSEDGAAEENADETEKGEGRR